MRNHRMTCRKCHEDYFLTNDEQKLHEDGELQNFICDDCFELENTPIDYDYMSYSDADCGL